MARDERELDWQRFQRHGFHAPSPDLVAYVARYWWATWSYDRPYRQLVVPYPNVHLSFRDGAAEVHGVSSRHVFRELDGEGRVFGLAFRPGAFRPFLGRAVSSITDRSFPAGDVFVGLPEQVDTGNVEAMLRANLPAPDGSFELARGAVDRIVGDPDVNRVGELARGLGTSVRSLQRLFADHVGIGPKWVIRRYRLHEATERMAAGGAVRWAALAADLGYADQAHFVRDFTAMFGESPTSYAARF